MKIIFLDIDGVLNGYNNFSLLCWKISQFLKIEKFYKKHRIDPFGIHKSKVRRLSKIVNATGARIVMSSSWRFRYQRYCLKISNGELNPEEDKSDMAKLYNLFKKYNINIIGFTTSGSSRGEEINDWLASHSTPESYVILDDENFDIITYTDPSKFVQTSNIPIGHLIVKKGCENTGLRRKHVKKAIKILNGR